MMRSRLALEKYMKPDSAFLGALGSFFLRGLRSFLPPPSPGGWVCAHARAAAAAGVVVGGGGAAAAVPQCARRCGQQRAWAWMPGTTLTTQH